MNDDHPPENSEFVEDESSRDGMNTNARSKLTACMKLKELVESNKIGVKSEMLLKEMKNFVRKKQSYEAQVGSTDDLISATLITIRIVETIAAYDDDAFHKLYSYDDDTDGDDNNTQYDEDAEPMPVVF